MSKSLEALDTLVNWGARYEPKSEYYYDLVKKDLEMLEILKKRINIYEWDEDGFIELRIDKANDNEGFEIVKEWLKNDN